jgi:hypothetical protein
MHITQKLPIKKRVSKLKNFQSIPNTPTPINDVYQILWQTG